MTMDAERATEVKGAVLSTPSPKSDVPWTQRPGWFSQHLGTAIVAAIIGYTFGHWLGNYLAAGYSYVVNSGQNTVADFLALAFGVVGWLLGIGALNYPLAKLVGKEAKKESDIEGFSKYFRYSTDHKVVGLQYVVSVLLFLFTGGLLAMAIRTELLSPTTHVFGPGTYIEIVSEHGTIMMMMATSIIVGPLGNYLVPLMIGSRRMAFPRIGLQFLGLHCRIYGHLLCVALWGLSDRVDGLRAAADSVWPWDDLVPVRVRGHRHRHDGGGLQHRYHDH